MRVTIQYQREAGGRVIAMIPALPGVMAYGLTKQEARCAVMSLAQMVISDEAEREQAKAAVQRLRVA